MMKKALFRIGSPESGRRSFVCDERGSVPVEMGFCGLVLVLVMAAIITVGGDLSAKVLSDFEYATTWLLDLI